jgi:hypothetical protein
MNNSTQLIFSGHLGVSIASHDFSELLNEAASKAGTDTVGVSINEQFAGTVTRKAGTWSFHPPQQCEALSEIARSVRRIADHLDRDFEKERAETERERFREELAEAEADLARGGKIAETLKRLRAAFAKRPSK